MKKLVLLAVLSLAVPLLRAQSVTAAEAVSHVGETTTVCGRVTGVHYAAGSKGKPTFINFWKLKGQTDSVSEIRMCNCISGLLSITYLKQQILYVVDSKQ
jgi:predicted porin